MRRACALACLALLCLDQTATAQTTNLTGPWRINGNGFQGDLNIVQSANGTLTGTMYGNPITGYAASTAGQALILRGPPNAPDQVYIASLAVDGRTLTGTFYALNAANGGASAARNVFPFRASKGTGSTPSSPGPLPGGVGSTANIAGSYTIDGNGTSGPLVIRPGADGAITGTVYGEQLRGHYAAGTGTAAFVRELNNLPFQVFVGTAYGSNPPRLSGTFYPLGAAGGASATRLQFEWNTGAPTPIPNAIHRGADRSPRHQSSDPEA